MELTNVNGYPIAFVNAAKTMVYKPNPDRIGVTQLINSPLVRTLLIEKWDEIILDVDDFIDRIYGIAVDKYLRQFEDVKILSQYKLELQLRNFILVGVPDRISLEKAFIGDYKFWKVASLRFEQTDAISQLNIYRYLAKIVMDWSIDKLFIHPMLKDWRILPSWQAKNERDYPECRIPTFELPIWDYNDVALFVADKLNDHISNPNRECTPEEKWQSESVFALKKKGRKQAVMASFAGSGGDKKFLTEKDCINESIKTKKIKNWPCKDFYIEARTGECRKCLNYCTVRNVCEFAKNLGE